MPRYPQTTHFPVLTPQSQPLPGGQWATPMPANNPYVPDHWEAVKPEYYNPQWAGPYSPGPNFNAPHAPYTGSGNTLPYPNHPGYPVDRLPKYPTPNNPPGPGPRKPSFPDVPLGGRGGDTPRQLIPGLRMDGHGGQRPPVFPVGKGMGGGQAPPPQLPPLEGALNGRGGGGAFNVPRGGGLPGRPAQGGR